MYRPKNFRVYFLLAALAIAALSCFSASIALLPAPGLASLRLRHHRGRQTSPWSIS